MVPCMVQGPGQYSIFTVSGPPVDTSIWTQGMPFQSRYRSSIVSDNSGCDHIRPLMVMMCIICDRPPDLFRLAESLSPEPFLWCSQLDMVS